jgi:hypothetical protein
MIGRQYEWAEPVVKLPLDEERARRCRLTQIHPELKVRMKAFLDVAVHLDVDVHNVKRVAELTIDHARQRTLDALLDARIHMEHIGRVDAHNPSKGELERVRLAPDKQLIRGPSGGDARGDNHPVVEVHSPGVGLGVGPGVVHYASALHSMRHTDSHLQMHRDCREKMTEGFYGIDFFQF